MWNFEDQVGIITGAASGIGLEVARSYAQAGGVAIIADTNRDVGQRTAQGLRDIGCKARFVFCDLGERRSIDALVAEVHERFGRIDFLHNNGFAPWRAEDASAVVQNVSDAQWHHTINLGLTSAFQMVRAIIPVMIAGGGGAIVNTASTAAYHPEPGISAYSAAKAGLVQFTRSVALEFADRGIRCNSVCPGVIRTPLIEGAPLDDDFVAKIPIGRLGEPAEVAQVVLFLASHLASYVTGANIVADGGRTL